MKQPQTGSDYCGLLRGGPLDGLLLRQWQRFYSVELGVGFEPGYGWRLPVHGGIYFWEDGVWRWWEGVSRGTA